jgi:hypothetical protein
VSATAAFALPSGTTVRGAGPGSALVFVIADDRYHQLFSINRPHQTFRDFKITVAISNPAGSAAVFAQSADDLVLDGMAIDCGMSSQNERKTYPLQFVGPTSGTLIEDTSVANCGWMGLKRNADTFATNRVQLVGLASSNMFGPIGLNSPNGPAADFVVERSTFDTNAFSGSGDSILALASVSRARIIGNYFKGRAGRAMHIEEASEDLIVQGNIVEGAFDDGIRILDNDIAGRPSSPKRIQVSDNILRTTSANRDKGSGLALSIDRSRTDAATDVSIHHNRVEGFADCFQTETSSYNNLAVDSNVAKNCANGFSLLRATAAVRDNFVSDSAVGYKVYRGGLLGTNGFQNCTHAFQAVHTKFAALGWRTMILMRRQGETIVDLPLLAIADRFSGDLSWGLTGRRGKSFSYRRYALNWDGKILTSKEEGEAVDGGFLDATPSVRSGTLDLHLAFSDEQADDPIEVQASFTGLWPVAVGSW